MIIRYRVRRSMGYVGGWVGLEDECEWVLVNAYHCIIYGGRDWSKRGIGGQTS